MNAVDVAGVVPAAEQHLAVVEHRRLVVAALIERHLLEVVAAVVAHDVQHERRLVAILVARVVLRLAVVDQDGLRRLLPRRDENDAAVRQIVRREVVALLSREVVDDEPPQPIGRDLVLPDVPLRLVFVVEIEALVDGAAHREQHLAAVARDLDARDVARAFREALRDVALRRRRRSAIANVEIRADGEAQDVAQVRVDLELVVLVVERAFRVCDREIRSYGIGILARADADAAVAVSAARGDRQQRSTRARATRPCRRQACQTFRVS